EISYREIAQAMDYVRRERKPFLLEAIVSRLYGHSSASGANRMNDEADCLVGFERKLEERGIRSRKEMDDLRKRFTVQLQEAHKKVRLEPQPDGKTIYDHVFADRDVVREG
ncbi:MAG TPA: thiamine pyrophosphate-dependent enzyme, partial [Myxococcales bacterium]|nr:thiamine pyrophosphate-dependent enzyme [Myxococcales bacterium]